MAYKKVTIIGTSQSNFEEAVDNAIDQAEETIENIAWAEVTEQGVELASAENPEYQAEVEIAFQVE